MTHTLFSLGKILHKYLEVVFCGDVGLSCVVHKDLGVSE